MPVVEDALFDEPNDFKAHDPSSTRESDEGGAVERVALWFEGHADLENRFSSALRQALDEVLDGQRTGRYDVDALEKTEKTYLGTKVEIICRTAFDLGFGNKMDYRVCGHEVDAKFSLDGRWMIPREAMGHICLLMAANDRRSSFKVGLVRVSEDVLTQGGNQDGKRNISSSGKRMIRWIIEEGKLKPNLLLGLDPTVREALSREPAGQNRVDLLFGMVHRRIIDRNAVLTVAKQLDAAKRVRDARKRLAPDGVVILGHQKESPRVAKALGLEVPEKGTWIATRLIPAPIDDGRPQVWIDGVSYVEARSDEKPQPAPAVDC
ncbi:NaeI family type II restriction endonuclease [Streptomyces niveiscabiei]|uniref:NaeI family type II restriction endonuclease n=1 Tax=Streptomyces niveiscabiei TaxID=164115 RepID=UPI0029ABEBC2|nr:NaeI family type II restriction endonuclease [Streptomyces niveiscabiei]MDX3383597.1 NaeI family type II restriction endonuclease [Streptomyces niveiscabiei]